METGLRVLLLLIGMAIVAGIIWDFRRNAAKKSNKIKSRDRERSVLESVEEFSLEMPLDIPYEDSFIQPGPVVTKPVHKPFGNKLSKTVFVKEPVSPVVEDILLIHIMARRPQLFSGAKLIEAFNEVHLFYNDSQILNATKILMEQVIRFSAWFQPLSLGFLSFQKLRPFKRRESRSFLE